MSDDILGPIDSIIVAMSGYKVTESSLIADSSEWMMLARGLFSEEALANYERNWPS